MVTFTCTKCQWTGKKKQVEKHYNRCRGEYFSCVDCGKEFAEDYQYHTSCIDEEDKYHGKWAKSQRKQKNRINHQQMIQNKKSNQNDTKSNSSNHIKTNGTKKRKLDEIIVNDSNPSTKKQKICHDTIAKNNIKDIKNKKSKKKILKKILKKESAESLSLKNVCIKFKKEINDVSDGNDLFFETLWKLNDKVMIKL